LQTVREALALRNKPGWHADTNFMLASVRDAAGLTLDDWNGMSAAAKYEKMSYHRALADMRAWEALTDKERRRLFNLWKLRKHQETEQRRRETAGERGEDA
jgi:hypothetical protein